MGGSRDRAGIDAQLLAQPSAQGPRDLQRLPVALEPIGRAHREDRAAFVEGVLGDQLEPDRERLGRCRSGAAEDPAAPSPPSARTRRRSSSSRTFSASTRSSRTPAYAVLPVHSASDLTATGNACRLVLTRLATIRRESRELVCIDTDRRRASR